MPFTKNCNFSIRGKKVFTYNQVYLSVIISEEMHLELFSPPDGNVFLSLARD